jgi:hypothetical protein
MFSVTYTGTNFLPLCTAMVCPTNSGKIVERRDQVFTTFLSLALFSTSIFTLRCSSTNGPFLVERAINLPLLYFVRRLTMKASVRLLLRVL